ncbi:MAG: FMN-binding negative transcriptional regulator [Chitinophagales bacterium]|nr:FMN-binding negative transcriptional regulator [Chitinophagales bacterium]
MYIPPYFKEEDKEELLAFIRQHPFATLVSQVQGRPWATHLPFVADEEDGTLCLTTHMAKANAQWKGFNGEEVLVVFQGPHAYISPSNYVKKDNVPTWNYIAVHAYGKVRLMEEAENEMVLLKMIAAFEAEFKQQYGQLDNKYLQGLLKGIVALEINVQELQGKYKLSQNKLPEEKQQIIHSLMGTDDPSAQTLGLKMQAYYDKSQSS